MPGHPCPSTTVIVPAGASRASRLSNAWPTAWADVRFEHRVGEVAVVEAPSAAGVALLPPAALLHDHRQRHPHERADIGSDDAVASRDEHRLVFAGERSHHLRHARVALARHLLEAFQQRDLGFFRQRRDRIGRRVQRMRRAHAIERGDCGLPLPTDRPRGHRRLVQRDERNVVGIREGLLFAMHGTDADAAVDVKTSPP